VATDWQKVMLSVFQLVAVVTHFRHGDKMAEMYVFFFFSLSSWRQMACPAGHDRTERVKQPFSSKTSNFNDPMHISTLKII
jgi:hypothetical protein